MKATEINGRTSKPARSERAGSRPGLLWSVPLGLQLSALYSLLLAVTLTLVGVLVYSRQESFLVDDVASRLQSEAVRIASIPLNPRDGGPGGRPNDGYHGSASEAVDHLIGNLINGLSGQGVTVAVLDRDGTVLASTQGLDGDEAPIVDPVSAEQVAAAVDGSEPLHWIVSRDDGSRRVIVLMKMILRPTQNPGAAQVEPITLLVEQSASLAAVDAALGSLGTFLLLGIIGGTVAGVVLGLALTRAVLRPLDRIATTAEAIAGGDLQRRLQLPPGRNEVARLGTSFDHMVSRLVATLEAQRRFIADASHELRTPLTSLKGLAEILMIGAHGDDSRVVEQSAGAIHGELDRMSRLVNDLLTLSRLDSTNASAPAPRRVRMDVCATVGAVADQMAALAETREVSLTKLCPEQLWIAGDPGQIKQVVLNLLDNALRYTPAGGAVSLSAIAEGRTARIEVRDTGSGIDPRELPHIFERFYRADSSRSRSTGNSGLGLAIAKAIVEAHGGSIEVTSTLGQGTSFTIILPLTREPTAPEKEPVLVESVR